MVVIHFLQVPEHLEPGLGDEQLRRLLEIELGTSTSMTPKIKPAPQPNKGIYDAIHEKILFKLNW